MELIILSRVRVTIDGVLDWILDLLTSYAHHSELQVITTLSLISTIHKSLHAKCSSACSAFKSRSLATASNTGDSSALRAQVTPVQRIFRNCFPRETAPAAHSIGGWVDPRVSLDGMEK
jgi:hypothetical protein